MTRWKAAAIHLALSAMLFVTIAALVIWHWYPPALLAMSGVDQLIGIIIAIDVVAGPLLTLVVYKAGKPSLKFDLTVIALVQLALLAYGLHTLAAVRPVFIVGVIDRFELVTANEIDPADLKDARAPYDSLSWLGPRYAGAVVPTDPLERSKLTESAMIGKDIHLLPRYFVPYEQVQRDLLAHSFRVDDLPSLTDADRRTIQSAVRTAGASVRYIPIHGTRGNALMSVDEAGRPLEPIAVDTWK